MIKAGLIDEFHLFVNPAAIGDGMTIFKNLNEMQKFTLVKSIAFDCGIVLLQSCFTMNQRESDIK